MTWESSTAAATINEGLATGVSAGLPYPQNRIAERPPSDILRSGRSPDLTSHSGDAGYQTIQTGETNSLRHGDLLGDSTQILRTM